MGGSPKKSELEKRLSGSDRPDSKAGPIPFTALEVLPKPPDWLSNHFALQEWNRLGALLVEQRLLTEAGLSAFGNLCCIHGDILQLRVAGCTPKGSLLSVYRSLTKDFGLTPNAPLPVKLGSHAASANRFTQHGTRPA